MKNFFFFLALFSTLYATPSMRPVTYEAIQKANKLLDTKQYQEAKELFDELIASTSKNRRYDHAFIQNAYGYLWIQKEDYTQAIGSYEKALAYKVLPKAMQDSITLTLAQLFLQQSAFQKTIDLVTKWHSSKKPSALSAKLLMIAYISLEDKTTGLYWCQKAVNLSQNPSLPLFQTKVSLELQLLKYPQAIQSLLYMLDHFKPKLIYFKQLAFLFAHEDKTSKGIALLESAFQMGLMEKKEDLLQLAQLLHQEGAPIKAVHIVQKLQDEYPDDEKLSNYLAILHLESKEFTQALKTLHGLYQQTKKPLTALKLAQLYAQKEHWKDSLFYAKKTKKAPQGILLQAISLTQLGKITSAINLFKKAKESPKTRTQAQMWLQHLTLN
ncbi:MAG: tetratricopeptide repeat protein [Thiovulaceae bacterium]|nr:tetratricopeptide repeat protein [Sulfurimonadaceae bacterium]